jgi:hypothetical protein
MDGHASSTSSVFGAVPSRSDFRTHQAKYTRSEFAMHGQDTPIRWNAIQLRPRLQVSVITSPIGIERQRTRPGRGKMLVR